jgi:N-acyl-L-homoserine lactone synthetase
LTARLQVNTGTYANGGFMLNQRSVTEAIVAVCEGFDIIVADSPSLIRQSYQLRHQVYCVERGFLGGSGTLEFDEYDSHSRHVVLVSRHSGQVVGTVRLVLPCVREPENSFPLQLVCDPHLLNDLPLLSTAEVSRFAISKEMLSGVPSGLMRLGLVQGLVEASHDLGITHWCAVMERSLLRLLRSSSIYFHPLGSLVEYHGPRQPCFSPIDALLSRVGREQPEIWEYLTQDGKFCSTKASTARLAA